MSEPSRAEEIVRAALRLPPGERAAYVAEACGADSALRERVEQLLAERTQVPDVTENDAGAGSRLPTVALRPDDAISADELPGDEAEPEAAAEPVATPPAAVEAGTLVAGKYRLARVLGQGGMGTVWLADQTEPVKRRVAVKLIKAGVDSRQVVARFEAERQALAVMDHPNIAKILDGGRIEASGVPFFVMELVAGIPITRFCDKHRLSPRQRLELFIPVCEAIQHAHQKGIIHRDLKPSNILVGMVDGRPVPKVIDFGVAKATGPALTDPSLQTLLGAVVGTPQYMSPEQAQTDQPDIDTRSDVYSLGIVLYELLAGSPPFDARKLGRGVILEILRIIREEDPPSPSSKLSTDEGLASISANRNMEPARLTRLIRGELDWIIMKALEKDRARRYESASGFAQDIRRYLAGEQVLAAPPSRVYRLRKFLRRHRGAVLTVSLVALALVGGIVGTTLGLLRAEAERANAVLARDRESDQRRQAEQATQQAFLALQSFTDEFVERQFSSKTILTANDRAILLKALHQWDAFAQTQGESQQARNIRAEGRYRVAVLRQRLGEVAEAEAGFRSAIDLLSGLVAEFPPDAVAAQRLVSARQGLGALLRSLRRFDEALAEFDLALGGARDLVAAHAGAAEFRTAEASLWSSRGVVLRALGRKQDALDCYQRARDIQAELVAAHPEDIKLRQALGTSHNNQGNLSLAAGELDRAETHFREGLRIREQLVKDVPESGDVRLELAHSHYGLADWHSARSDVPGALREYRLALAILEKLHADYPLVPEYRDSLGSVHRNVGVRLRDLEKYAEALAEYEQAVRIYERLAAGFPGVPDYRRNLALDRVALGNLLVSEHQLDRADREFEQASRALEQLHREFPSTREFRADLAECQDSWGLLDAGKGAPRAAQARYAAALKLRENLAREFPDEPKYTHGVMLSHWRLGDAAIAQKDSAGAVEQYLLAIDWAERLVRQLPGAPNHVTSLFRLRFHLAVVYENRNALPAARAQYEQALVLAQQLAGKPPQGRQARLDLAGCHNNFSTLLNKMGEPGPAAEHLDEALRLLQQLGEAFPGDVAILRTWSGSQVNRAGQLRAAGRVEPALALVNPAIDRLDGLLKERPADGAARAFLQNGLNQRAQCLDQLKRYADSARDWERLAGLVPEAERVVYRSKTAQSLVRQGETTRALEIAESLAHVQEPPTIFARARVFALAYGQTKTEAQALRSLELLRQLVARGFNDVKRLQTDPDLAALRDREDFRGLIATIEPKRR